MVSLSLLDKRLEVDKIDGCGLGLCSRSQIKLSKFQLKILKIGKHDNDLHDQLGGERPPSEGSV